MSNALANGLAGAGGGIIAQIITYPLQTVNTRQQTERTAKKKSLAADGAATAPAPPGGGTLFQILQVIRTEGWGGLYSGLKPSLVGTAASQGIYYYFYQVFKNKAEARAVARKKKGLGDGTVGMFSWLVVAAVAGSVNVLLTNPIWVLVTRMQTHTQAERKIMEAKREAMLMEASDADATDMEAFKEKLSELDSTKPHPFGTFHAAREVYNETGIKGFWKGLIPTLIMVFLLGALAKLGATVSTYPLLVVKSRLQAKQEIGRNVMLRYTGTLDAIIKMIRYEGLYGFYKGMGTKIVQSVFAASVLFMVKEELVKAILFLTDESRKILLTFGK
ncbi:peroxisomal nicotinamide adenine dinucleotide carrier isoform X2 [Elaeis guineensis]|uniref:Peroxisomal nicotinamide adenine dinucleotide carrier isoform X2 n=1 Tax=Elaeis guineensis var. tenera TaxID=51953 RepID=A0A6I9S2B0_ELAGV|nr:peroxisomal nicotinamide adenine dinucleotide carrier isoform X2 [Elaeis guineensis]